MVSVNILHFFSFITQESKVSSFLNFCLYDLQKHIEADNLLWQRKNSEEPLSVA